MARERKGSIIKRKSDGLLYARVTFVDSTGKRRDKLRRADDRTHARELIRQMLRELEDNGENALDVSRKTFADLADYYESNYLVEAEYVNGRKIFGLRSLSTPKGFLKILRVYFGKQLLRTITYGNVRAFRALRLATPTRGRAQRSVTSVNRELALLRRMFNVAQREGWLLKNPMNNGENLISISSELKRQRVITYEEEGRLLNACSGRRKHLRAIVIAAIETGMRKGELLKLKWSDVNFQERIIYVQAFNTKTASARVVGMTSHLVLELERLWQLSSQIMDDLVFGFKDNVKKSFDGARRDAGLVDVRFHDLRHTHATRLVSAHVPMAEIARALGHQQLATTYRYTNQTHESVQRTADALEELRLMSSPSPEEALQLIN
jgi:integrase